MRLPRFSKTEWALLMATIIFIILFLCGCGPRGLPQPGIRTPSVNGIPALIQRIAMVFTGMATVALFFCGIALWFIADKASIAKYALISFTVLIVAGLLYWLAEHWGWAIGLGFASLGAGIGGYAYLHQKDIKRKVCRILNTPVKNHNL